MPTGIYKRTKPAWSKGIPRTEEVKRKISIATRGKKRSKEHRRKMSKAMKGTNIGEKNGHWKGGKTININKYNNDRYKNLPNKQKKYVSWLKNKRNRLKRCTIKELGTHTYGDWGLLKKQYNYICPCCKKSEPEIKLTEDHIIPLSKGGSDLIENIQPLCRSCNCKKHTKIIKY